MCETFIKPKFKCQQFKSNIDKDFDRCEHIELTIEISNKNGIDEIFYAYIIEHNKKYDYYLFNCHFKLFFY